MSVKQSIQEILAQVLQLNDQTIGKMNLDTPLLGAIPEFDSMAVVSIITSLEERFGFVIDDDEIDASVFENLGSLIAFVETKV